MERPHLAHLNDNRFVVDIITNPPRFLAPHSFDLSSPHKNEITSDVLIKEVHRQFLIAGGYTPGKHVQTFNVEGMFNEDSGTNTLGMLITTFYPFFSATSELGLPNHGGNPHYRIHFSPYGKDQGIPHFSLFYDLNQYPLRVRICSKALGDHFISPLQPSLFPLVAQLFVSSLGAWASVCQRNFAQIYIHDSRALCGYLPLTPITPDLYNDHVADRIAKYQSIAQGIISRQDTNPVKDPNKTTQVTRALLAFNMHTFNPSKSSSFPDSSLSLYDNAHYVPGILEYSGPVPEDPTPGFVLDLVEHFRR